ncbi:MAG TPA: ATP-binding protein [Candidatus Deferrimicrobium sp.]|nr:ATP-binding protein [Candidatus Deferrimicrobium sp.]
MINTTIKVLLIEDNPADIRLFQEMASEIKERKIISTNAKSLSEGQQYLKNGTFDLILLDLGLPDSQGLDTFKKIYTLSPKQPIIVLTGLYDERVGRKAVSDGAQDFLIKGEMSSPLLSHAISYAIERFKITAELEIRVAERTKELREAQEQLIRKEKLATVGKLASSIGHELRNPLGVINNSIYYLKMKLKDADEKILKYLSVIENEVQKSNKIITDLLDFSRIKPLSLKESDINSIIKDSLNNIIVPESISVQLDFDSQIPKTFVDPIQIQQILDNIILNAIQAMPEGGALFIKTAIEDNWIKIVVKDTGSGIPKENFEKIFEPLFTTKARGIGLGLPIVKDIVEKHKGRIELESILNNGTTFIINLPISK